MAGILRRTHLAVVPALVLVLAVLAGCSSDEPESAPAGEPEPAAADSDDTAADSEETTSEETTGDETTGDETTYGEDAGTITVTAVDYGFEGLPASAPVGTRLELVNESDAEFHELVAIRLPDDETRPVSELVQLPEEETENFPDPAMVLLAPPSGGEMFAAVGDGTFTEPGRYALVCFIPVGADPAVMQQAIEGAGEEDQGDGPPEGEEGPPPGLGDGPPHVAEGMFAELLVE